MRFQVPQFIEVKDKIFGPFSFKQFIYIAGGGGLCFITYYFLPFFIAILLIIPIGTLSAALAFYKVNNKNFIEMIEYFFRYTIANKLYIWKKEKEEIKKEVSKKEKEEKLKVPTLSEGKLNNLSWSLETKEKFREGE